MYKVWFKCMDYGAYWASVEIIAFIWKEYIGCCDLLGAIWLWYFIEKIFVVTIEKQYYCGNEQQHGNCDSWRMVVTLE